MLERARIQRDLFQVGDRRRQIGDRGRYFCRRRVIICRCALCRFDRCLQCLIAYFAVAICRDRFRCFDQRIQLGL